MFYHPATQTRIPEGTAFVLNGRQYPANWLNLTSLAEKTAAGIFDLVVQDKPAYNPETQVCTPGAIQYLSNVWTETWDVSPLPTETVAANLAAAKAAKNNQINAWRATANQTTFPHAGKLVACDSLSRSDIDAVANSIALTGSFPAGFPGAWKATDNSYIPLPDVAAFKAMHSSMTLQGTINFGHSQTLKATLAAATTLAQVNAITWE